MHESIFNYNVTRPYPFRWFTPIVFVGGLLALILFSFLNLVSNSTFLVVDTTINPNKTISDGVLFKHWPSYLTSRIQPICQSVDIPVNTKFFTNQTALTYTLTGVSQKTPDAAIDVLPSLTYHNNLIEDCRLNAIEMDLDALDRLAAQLAWAEWGVNLRAYLSCLVEGQTMFNLTVQYDYAPETVSFDKSTLFAFIGRDKDKKAALWWGESLLSMYWVSLSKTMQDIRSNASATGQDTIRKGTVYFTPGKAATAAMAEQHLEADALDPSFFNVEYSFIKDSSQVGAFTVDFHGINQPATTIPILSSQGPNQDIWPLADALAKSFLSTILVDLGQVSSPFPNLLINATALQHFTAPFPTILENLANARPGPAQEDFNTLKSTTGPLQVTPSVIFSKYICQVPRKKSAINIIIAVLIADLVFLQALWKMLTWGTEALFLGKRKDGSHANRCDGCRVGEPLRGCQYGGIVAVEAGLGNEKVRKESPSPSSSRQRLLGLP
ncbi:MAG: hypothetical protein Q9160_002334 [Pyrenula sp. 1 TL-2023]